VFTESLPRNGRYLETFDIMNSQAYLRTTRFFPAR
jgi:hypothetical protein